MKLEQKIGWHARESFFLFEDKVRIESVRFLRRAEYALNYSEMHENPVRTRQVAWAWYIWAAILLSLAAICGFRAVTGTDPAQSIIAWILCVVATIMGAIAAVAGRRRTFDVVAFRGMGGNCVLHTNRPGPDEFSAFIAELQRRIADSRSIERRTVAGVLDVLHRQGIIDDWQHQQLRAQFQLNT